MVNIDLTLKFTSKNLNGYSVLTPEIGKRRIIRLIKNDITSQATKNVPPCCAKKLGSIWKNQCTRGLEFFDYNYPAVFGFLWGPHSINCSLRQLEQFWLTRQIGAITEDQQVDH